MPFGFKNAPRTFQCMMNNGSKGLIGNGCFVYIDDIVVYGKTIKEQNDNLKKLFQRFRQVNLKLPPSKCDYRKKFGSSNPSILDCIFKDSRETKNQFI